MTKPAAAIFQHALAQMGQLSPARAADGGDNPKTDIAGAAAPGACHLLGNPSGRRSWEATHEIHHFAHLCAMCWESRSPCPQGCKTRQPMGCLFCIRPAAAEAGRSSQASSKATRGQHGLVEVELRMMVGGARLAPRMR